MKIFCIGRNYAAHAQELGNSVPSRPVIFMKPRTALLQDNKPFFLPNFNSSIHYECELVLRIGKNGKAIPERVAHSFIHSIGLGIDFTARDLQGELKAKGHPWEIAKAFDKSALLGDLKPVESFDLTKPIHFSLHKNGEVVQRGDTSLMLFNFSRILAEVSKYFTVQQGDLIYTGTPAGVGPIEIGDKLQGFLEESSNFNCEIL